jgi:hypothetical protein
MALSTHMLTFVSHYVSIVWEYIYIYYNSIFYFFKIKKNKKTIKNKYNLRIGLRQHNLKV